MKIYLYGNCQTGALLKMMVEDNPDWSVAACDVSRFAEIGPAEIQQHLEQARAADVVISQSVGDYRGLPELSLDALRAEVRPGTPVITLAPIVFEGTHGAFTYLRNRLPGFQMEYHNSHSIDLLLHGYHWRDISLLQASPEFYTPDFVSLGIDASVAELEYRETVHETTIKIAGTFAEYARSMVLVNTINHPRRFVLARMLNAIYRQLSLPAVASETGVDYLLNPYLPPLPTVLHHLGIADERPQIEANGQVWTRDAYLQETLTYYARLLRIDLITAFAGARGETFLTAFHKANLRFAATGVSSGEPLWLDPHRLITDAFLAFLGRPPGPDELDVHTVAIRSGGLGAWFKTLANADELTARYQADPAVN